MRHTVYFYTIVAPPSLPVHQVYQGGYCADFEVKIIVLTVCNVFCGSIPVDFIPFFLWILPKKIYGKNLGDKIVLKV